MKKILIISCALALASLSNVALAAGGNGFVRAEVGSSDVDIDISGFGSASDTDTSFAVRGGYYFNANFAVEAAYNHLYDQSENGASLKLTSFGVGIVGKKNFGANDSGFFIDGRVGIETVKGDVDDGFDSASDNTTEAYYGVGVGYDFSESFGVSVNYDIHKAGFDGVDVDADTISVGGEFRF